MEEGWVVVVDVLSRWKGSTGSEPPGLPRKRRGHTTIPGPSSIEEEGGTEAALPRSRRRGEVKWN